MLRLIDHHRSHLQSLQRVLHSIAYIQPLRDITHVAGGLGRKCDIDQAIFDGCMLSKLSQDLAVIIQTRIGPNIGGACFHQHHRDNGSVGLCACKPLGHSSHHRRFAHATWAIHQQIDRAGMFFDGSCDGTIHFFQARMLHFDRFESIQSCTLLWCQTVH